MLTEKVRLDVAPGTMSQPLDAYLVEAQSWGGQSGSPAFVHFAINRQPGMIVFNAATQAQFMLLGLVHGHDDIGRAVVVEGEATKASVPINSGIAIVIPADHIGDVINGEQFRAERDAARARLGGGGNEGA